MQLDYVVQILQAGLAGLAFLLAFLSFKIISKEQSKEIPRSEILQSARNYFVMCIILAVIVGGFQVTQYLLESKDELRLSECRDSFEILSSREDRATSIEDMSRAIQEHIGVCGPLIKELDRNK